MTGPIIRLPGTGQYRLIRRIHRPPPLDLDPFDTVEPLPNERGAIIIVNFIGLGVGLVGQALTPTIARLLSDEGGIGIILRDLRNYYNIGASTIPRLFWRDAPDWLQDAVTQTARGVIRRVATTPFAMACLAYFAFHYCTGLMLGRADPNAAAVARRRRRVLQARILFGAGLTVAAIYAAGYRYLGLREDWTRIEIGYRRIIGAITGSGAIENPFG